MRKYIFLFAGLLLAQMSYAALDVRHFGAKGDGTTLDTRAIQSAIDSAAVCGGEIVVLPPGRYLSGTLILKNNVALHIEKGAILLGSTSLDDYPQYVSHYVSHINRYSSRSLIFAEGVENISISGEGTIDGQGSLENYPATETETLMGITRRPYLIRVISCKGVKLSDIHLRNSPAWTQHYLDCENVFIDGIDVYNHGNYNNDGIDIDNCRQVRIVNSHFNTDDDAICFKTTNATGRCENVVVANCVIAANCNAMKWGSETNGGFRNFTITNCTFRRAEEPTIYDRPHRTLGGLAIETVDGALLENFNISNISMYGVMTPIFIRLADRGRNYYDGGPSQPTHCQSHGSNAWLGDQFDNRVGKAPCRECNFDQCAYHLRRKRLCGARSKTRFARTRKRISRNAYFCRRSGFGAFCQECQRYTYAECDARSLRERSAGLIVYGAGQ